MKFMTMVKTTSGAVKTPPPPALYEGIMKLGMEAGQKGVLVQQGGLLPIEAGGFVTLIDGDINVIDGPFAEARELVGGFAVYEVPAKADALYWAKRFMEVHRANWPGWEGEVEVRQMMDQP